MYEEEAELGSDNEENDDNKKNIDKIQEMIDEGLDPNENLD